MRNQVVPVIVLAVLIGMPSSASGQPESATLPAVAASGGAAQSGHGAGSGSGSGSGTATTQSSARSSKPAADAAEQASTLLQPSPASLKGRSNVQIELIISDQTGNGPIDKKTVTMIAASGTWGKIRAAGVARPNERTGNVAVGLNVDARPFVFPDGVVQVELTIGYNPLGTQSIDSSQVRPTELNQSLTVVLQNGKPLVVSQAADPVSDRKIIVEVKATLLK